MTIDRDGDAVSLTGQGERELRNRLEVTEAALADMHKYDERQQARIAELTKERDGFFNLCRENEAQVADLLAALERTLPYFEAHDGDVEKYHERDLRAAISRHQGEPPDPGDSIDGGAWPYGRAAHQGEEGTP